MTYKINNGLVEDDRHTTLKQFFLRFHRYQKMCEEKNHHPNDKVDINDGANFDIDLATEQEVLNHHANRVVRLAINQGIINARTYSEPSITVENLNQDSPAKAIIYFELERQIPFRAPVSKVEIV